MKHSPNLASVLFICIIIAPHARGFVHSSAGLSSRQWQADSYCHNTQTISSTALFKGNRTETNTEKFYSDNLVPNGDLLLVDVGAVVLACQLLGLQDVLNDPNFWQNGGWFQAPALPSTLPTLALRISQNSLSWIVASVIVKGFSFETQSSTAAVMTACKIAAGFTVLRLLISLTATGMHLDDWDGVDVLQECYNVSLVGIATRYLFNRITER
ncbi:hypothetical protein MPSEU_000710200 [Mayamaea pseudoterrestris]|nr:hypothetical protein MPSEU_000710200 [Mayamaea pseudoterrestris]